MNYMYSHKLQEFFGFDIPSYVIDATDRALTILLDTGGQIDITPQDVADYTFANHGMSGGRSFAGIYGDWRMMDNLASLAMSYFEEFNRESLEEALCQNVNSELEEEEN